MAVIEITNKDIKKFPNYSKADVFSYNGIEFVASLVKQKPDSLKVADFLDIVEALGSKSYKIDKDSLKVACGVYERNQDVFYKSFIPNYGEVGNINCYATLLKPSALDAISKIEEDLSERFKAKFRGRVPGIVHSMAIASYLYNVPPEEIVTAFNINNARLAMNHLSPLETTILLLGARGINSPSLYDSDISKYAVKCYCYALKDGDSCYKEAGDWIANHPQTSEKFLKKISKKASDLTIDKNSTVDSITAQLGKLSSVSEVQKIEKAYKKCNFKFRDCVFDLKFTDVVYDKYRMEILRPGDTRMVYLGYDTNCCQVLGDAGESAMMHGLLNPKAGFWCMTDERTGRIVAQAEIWEKENDSDTLVFDNIEFANDADVGLYRKPIGKWLEASGYKNIYMGVAYNQFFEDSTYLTSHEALTPWVTPKEIYIISHEKESEAIVFRNEEEAANALTSGIVTYFDYVYCDSERQTVVMKENNIVEPYFVAERLEELSEELSEASNRSDECMEEEMEIEL